MHGDTATNLRRILNRSKRTVRRRRATPYYPLALQHPERTIDVESAWKGHELAIPDILERFNIGRTQCLEFGVEFGYSTVALSNYFDHVIGVDLFTGDIHTIHQGDHFEQTLAALSRFENIELARCDYRDWIARDDAFYDLIHVDIVHTYADTFSCGVWSVEHSSCVLFHDTESFADVRDAVWDVATKTNKRFYNYEPHNGLGIVV